MRVRSISADLLVIGTVAGTLSATVVPEITLEQLRNRIGTASLQAIVQVSEIPQPVLAILQAHIPAVPWELKGPLLAEPGEPFNAGCNVDSSLSDRRLMVGAGSASLWLILYEHGGLAAHSHLVAIDPVSRHVAALELSSKSRESFHNAPEFIRAIRAGEFRKVGLEKVCRF